MGDLCDIFNVSTCKKHNVSGGEELLLFIPKFLRFTSQHQFCVVLFWHAAKLWEVGYPVILKNSFLLPFAKIVLDGRMLSGVACTAVLRDWSL